MCAQSPDNQTSVAATHSRLQRPSTPTIDPPQLPRSGRGTALAQYLGMDNRYRDETELHQASPLLAVLVAAMTLATAPLTQAGTPSGAAVEPSRILEQVDGFTLAGGACMIPADEPTCEAPVASIGATSSDAQRVESGMVVSSSPLRIDVRTTDS